MVCSGCELLQSEESLSYSGGMMRGPSTELMKPKLRMLSLGDGSLDSYLICSAGNDCIITSFKLRLSGLLLPSTGFVMASSDSSISCHFRRRKFLLMVTFELTKSCDD